MKKYFCLLTVVLFSYGLSVAKADTAAISFTDPNNLLNNGTGFSLGFSFTALNALTIDALGYYNGDGMQNAHDVGVFDSQGHLLESAEVTGGSLGFDYVSIAPLTLIAGGIYQIMGTTGTVDPYVFNPIGFSTASDITFDGDEFTQGNILAPGSNTAGVTGFFGPNFLIASPTPEPSTMVLLGTGLLGSIGVVRRKLRA